MKLKTLLEENRIYSQNEMKEAYDNLTTPEKDYEKRSFSLNFELADKEKKIETTIDGKKETANTAKKGDYILTGTGGETYVLTPEKFKKRYDVVEGKAKTKPVRILAKEWNKDPITFKASWGENMIIERGDFLVKNGKEYYRIEKKAFHKTYIEA